MDRRSWLTLSLLALPAVAQPTSLDARPGLRETQLHLSETGTASRDPEEVEAILQAEFRAPQAAAAQGQLNRVVAAALAAARATPGIAVRAGSPSADREQGRGWTATQTLILRGCDPEPMLALVGRLQQNGLALSNLAWRLTDAQFAAAREEGTRDAMRQLRARAALVAETLDMVVGGVSDIAVDAPLDLDQAAYAPVARASRPTPQITREAAAIVTRVTARIILVPK